jgi:hypothetical protein
MPFIFACPLAIMFPSSFIPATARPPEANRHLLQSRTAKLGMGLPRTRMAEQKAIKKNTPEPPHDQRALRVAEDQHAHQSKAKFRPGAPIPLRVILLVLSVLVVSVFVWERWNRKTRGESSPQTVVAAAPVYTPGKTLRAMVGSPAPYVDHGGFTWDGDHFCSGGSSFSISGHTVQGTEDSLLFSGGRRGIFLQLSGLAGHLRGASSVCGNLRPARSESQRHVLSEWRASFEPGCCGRCRWR